jgi:hypothetical protein
MADLTPQALAKIRSLLEEARRQIAAEVASTDWDRYHQPKLLARIDELMIQFGEGAAVGLKKDLDGQFVEGQKAVDASLARFINVAQFPDISVHALAAMHTDLGTRIKNLTRYAPQEIQRTLSLGLLGGKTPFETMQMIGKSLDDPGRFKTIAQRAEMIVREEFGRVFRKAGQLRLEAAGLHVSGLKKQWLHAGHPAVPRLGHLALHGTVIGINERFEIIDPVTGEIEAALHPKDTALSAKNTINCGCVARPWKEGWELAGKAQPLAAAVSRD